MKIVLSTFGSFGDVHPYVAIALELKRRGHRPVIATSEAYREKMDALALDFHPVRPVMPSWDDPDAVGKLVAEMLNARRGPERVFDFFVPHLRDAYEDLLEATRGADLLLTHPLPLVGPVVADKTGVPWVSSVLAPISIFSAQDPPVPPQMPAMYHLLKLSPWVARALMRLGATQFARFAGPVYRLRESLGLPRGRHPVFEGQHSPALVLALFSKVLARPQPDWPPKTHVTGFAFYDRRDFFGETETPPALLEFLEAGPPPVVFTLGSSAFWVAEDFYRDSMAAALSLGERALLLVGHERNRPPGPPPEGVAVFEYAPYGEVLPRARAVVHQGGVGTTGQALRSGRPELVLPHAHDQFDNGARVARLGAGRTLPRPRYNARTAERELKALLTDESYAIKAAEAGRVVQGEDGAGTACDLMEEMMKTGNFASIVES